MREYIKHLLIRTPLETPARRIQYFIDLGKSSQYPELSEIFQEPLRMEKTLKKIIHPSANCLDIGSYLGSVLSQITKLAPRGKHIAFEPVPTKATWLRRKFPDVDIEEIALSDKPGQVPFHVNTKCSGFSKLATTEMITTRLQTIIVRSDSLDNFLDFQHAVNFIKIDVEGAELSVLEGAVNTLRHYHPAIIFECGLSNLTSFNITPEEIFAFLTRHDYKIFLLKDFLDGGKPLSFERFAQALQYPFQAFNFLAV